MRAMLFMVAPHPEGVSPSSIQDSVVASQSELDRFERISVKDMGNHLLVTIFLNNQSENWQDHAGSLLNRALAASADDQDWLILPLQWPGHDSVL